VTDHDGRCFVSPLGRYEAGLAAWGLAQPPDSFRHIWTHSDRWLFGAAADKLQALHLSDGVLMQADLQRLERLLHLLRHRVIGRGWAAWPSLAPRRRSLPIDFTIAVGWGAAAILEQPFVANQYRLRRAARSLADAAAQAVQIAAEPVRPAHFDRRVSRAVSGLSRRLPRLPLPATGEGIAA
jgi:hypothetical protein